METNRLKQFCVIAETGSMTKASRLLHISHSGLSKSMKLLQEEAGCVLLQAAGRGLSLTETGVEIYHRAKQFILQEAHLFALDKKPLSPISRIGIPGIFLLPFCATLKQHPLSASTLAVLNVEPGSIEQSIVNKQLDLGITNAPFPMEQVDIMEIGQYRSGCYHLQGTFAGQALADIPFVAPVHGLASNSLGITELDGWPEHLYPRNKKFRVDRLLTAVELTLQGVCAIYIPDFLARHINASRHADNQLVEYPLSKRQKIVHRVFILKHKEQSNELLYEQLSAQVKEIICSP